MRALGVALSLFVTLASASAGPRAVPKAYAWGGDELESQPPIISVNVPEKTVSLNLPVLGFSKSFNLPFLNSSTPPPAGYFLYYAGDDSTSAYELLPGFQVSAPTFTIGGLIADNTTWYVALAAKLASFSNLQRGPLSSQISCNISNYNSSADSTCAVNLVYSDSGAFLKLDASVAISLSPSGFNGDLLDSTCPSRASGILQGTVTLPVPQIDFIPQAQPSLNVSGNISDYDDLPVSDQNAGAPDNTTQLVLTVNGTYNPCSVNLITFSVHQDLHSQVQVGPFAVANISADVDIFQQRTSAGFSLNFNGSVSLDVELPFLESAGFDFAASTSLRRATDSSNASTQGISVVFNLTGPSNFFALRGVFNYLGRFNPDNKALCYLSLPFLSKTAQRKRLRAALIPDATEYELPIMLLDTFSGFYRTNSDSFTFDGVAGSATGNEGSNTILHQPEYYFPSILNDILNSSSWRPPMSFVNPSVSVRDTLGLLRRKTGHRMRARTLDATSDINLSFPAFSFPAINLTYFGGEQCVAALFGSTSSPPSPAFIFPGSGSISSLLTNGFPLYLSIPSALAGDITATLDGLLGPTGIALRNISLDIRRLPDGYQPPNNESKGVDLSQGGHWEGALGAMGNLGDVQFELHVVLSTAAIDPAALANCSHQALPRDETTVFSAQLVRLFYVSVAYRAPLFDILGDFAGIMPNGTCGSILFGDIHFNMRLADGNADRENFTVRGILSPCGQPLWQFTAYAGMNVDNYAVYGDEVIVDSVTLAVEGTSAGNATLWDGYLFGHARNIFGFAEASVNISFDDPRGESDFEVLAAFNGTQYQNSEHSILTVSGDVYYYRNQSAGGDFQVDFSSSFGNLSAIAAFHKYARDANTTSVWWDLSVLIPYLNFDALQLTNASLLIKAINPQVNMTNGTTIKLHDPPNQQSYYDASLSVEQIKVPGLVGFEGSGSISWSSATSTADIEVAINFHNAFLDIRSDVNMTLPLSENSTARGEAFISLNASTFFPGAEVGTFTGAIMYCRGNVCGDAEVEGYSADGSSLVRFEEDQPLEQKLCSESIGNRSTDLIELMSLITRMRAYQSDGVLVVDGNAQNWTLGPLDLRKLALSMFCTNSCCAGVALGVISVNGLQISMGISFSSQKGPLQAMLDFNMHEDFVTVTGAVAYVQEDPSVLHFVGNLEIVLLLPFDSNTGKFSNAGSASARIVITAGATYIVNSTGTSLKLSLSSTDKIPVGIFTFQLFSSKLLRSYITATNTTCWSGTLTFVSSDSDFPPPGMIRLTCPGQIDYGVAISIPFEYGQVDASLWKHSNGSKIGCASYYEGNGTVTLNNLPSGVSDMSTSVIGVACNASSWVVSTSLSGTSADPTGFIIPLGFTNIKVGNVGAVVAKNGSDWTVVVAGEIGFGASASMDVLLNLPPSSSTQSPLLLAGIQGPLDIAGLVRIFAPGATLGADDSSFGKINNVMAVFSTNYVLAVFNMSFNGVNYAAQLSFAKTAGKSADPVQMTLVIFIEGPVSGLPSPINSALEVVFGQSSHVTVLFSLCNIASPAGNSSLSKQIIDEATSTLNFLSALPGGTSAAGAIATLKTVLADLNAIWKASTVAFADSVPAGLSLAIEVGEQDPAMAKFNDFKQNTANSSASSQALSETSTSLMLLVSFDWTTETFIFKLKLSNPTDAFTGKQPGFELASIYLFLVVKPNDLQVGFGVEFHYTTDKNRCSFSTASSA
eukprot:m.805503 g.805503  ORF g.805503 m.805503 type:complete len:1722 (-) comp59290_c0_seq12:4583-9748(-)